MNPDSGVLDRWSAWLGALFDQALGVWMSGGWAMIPIAAVALIMFALGASIYLRLAGKGHRSVSEREWRAWIEGAERRRGPIGRLLDFVTGNRTIASMAEAFSELRMTEIAPFERDIKVMRVCVGAAPLFGLLGTVTGMLATFHALASGSGGEKTMGMIARGISEALITTETGLVIALPGLFLQYQLARNCERYKAFLAHLETVCMQSLHRGSAAVDSKTARSDGAEHAGPA
jgi:biopolymer transport protein ExbB